MKKIVVGLLALTVLFGCKKEVALDQLYKDALTKTMSENMLEIEAEIIMRDSVTKDQSIKATYLFDREKGEMLVTIISEEGIENNFYFADKKIYFRDEAGLHYVDLEDYLNLESNLDKEVDQESLALIQQFVNEMDALDIPSSIIYSKKEATFNLGVKGDVEVQELTAKLDGEKLKEVFTALFGVFMDTEASKDMLADSEMTKEQIKLTLDLVLTFIEFNNIEASVYIDGDGYAVGMHGGFNFNIEDQTMGMEMTWKLLNYGDDVEMKEFDITGAEPLETTPGQMIPTL